MRTVDFKKVLIGLATMSMILFWTVSCTKNDDKVNEPVIMEEDIIGTWTASAGKYNLSLEITEADYTFNITEPGNGGTYDKGTYSVSDGYIISFVSNDKTVLAIGELREDGKMRLTFVSSVAIMMLGTEAASSTVFTRDDGSTGGTEGYTVSGSLEYSEAATWSKVSAVFDEDGNDAVTTSIVNGAFSLVMPVPKASSLSLVSEEFAGQGITISPLDAKAAIATFFASKGTQSAEIAHIGLSSDGSIVSIIMYIYADRNVSVSGTFTYPNNGGKDVYNLQLKSGWNTVINTWDYSTTYDDFYTTGAVPSNSTWITEADVSDSSAKASVNRTYAGGKKPNVFRAAKIK